jgi:hypothetical protein
LLPSCRWSCMIRCCSSSVNGDLLTDGSRWLCHLHGEETTCA